MAATEQIAAPGAATVSCALVITREAHREVLVLGEDSEYRLPSIEIPRRERAAPHINDAVRRLWGIESVCLFAAPASPGSDSDGTRRCYVVEARRFDGAGAHDSSWVSVRDPGRCRRLRVEDADTLRSALAETAAFEAGEDGPHFVRSGWFEEVTGWVRRQVPHHGWLLDERWTQYAMGPDFCLIRFETTGPCVWFKAAGTREYAISLALAELRSEYLPRHLAKNFAWHGWLMADAAGFRLDECDSLQAWSTAASSLAALQIDSACSSEALIAAGCHDLRTGEIEKAIDPFIAAVAELMAAQPTCPPRILTDADLRTVAARLREGCALLGTLPILPCLGHGDLNPGNMIVEGKGAVFLDWAAGMVGHPFFSCEYLLALFRRLHPDRTGWTAAIRAAYLLPWRRFCPAEAIEQSLAWMPLVAPLAWALRLWRGQPRSGGTDVYTARLLRSIARRLHGEAMLLEGKGSVLNFEERR
jgi:hypothetical protein